MKNYLSGLLLISAFLLTGCASTFSSKVTTVNNLPSSLSDKSYTIALNSEHGDTTEYAHASDEIKARLHELGFIEAKSSETAALQVAITLSTLPGNAHISSPFGAINYLVTPSGAIIPLNGFISNRFYPSMYAMPLRYPYSRFYPRSFFYTPYASPFYSPFYLGRRFDPFYGPEMTVRQSFEHTLSVVISDLRSGNILYSVNANTEQTSAEMDEQISLLVEVALKNFPNKSGNTYIDLEVEK